MNKEIRFQWGTRVKVPVENSYDLSLVYTPGVAVSCLEIKQNTQKAFELTNRSSNIAVIGINTYAELVQRALDIKQSKNYDGFPILISAEEVEKIFKVIKNLIPTFYGFDLSLLPKNVQAVLKIKLTGFKTHFLFSEKDFETLPVVKSSDDKEIRALLSNQSQNIKENSIKLHKVARGVVETAVVKATQTKQIKPIAVISDGTAVLGLGNIGADAALPVMEGKSALFKILGGLDAIPICLETQDAQEFIDVVSLIADSFSGINLEDISAPKCFDIEKALIDKLQIPVMHDDRHGTAVVVKAGLLNALKLTNKELRNVKIVMSGAGAAAQTVAYSLLSEGAKNLTLSDINGIVYKGRKENDRYLEEIASKTNPNNLKGTLKDAIQDADVFIGLSAPNILTSGMVKMMAPKAIVFALANPTPEIMPDLAYDAGAFIVATGRSDFSNQINNSLAFPGIFKGVIENKIVKITDEIKSAASKAIASSINAQELSTKNIMPCALDKKIPQAIAQAIKGLKA